MKKIFQKLLLPKFRFVFLCVMITVASLIYIFTNKYDNEWFAYPVFLFSAYTLTILCAGTVNTIKHGMPEVKLYFDRVPLLKRYITDLSFRFNISIYCSFATNALYAVLKCGYGIYYKSVWFVTLGVYYISLAFIRLSLLKYARKRKYGTDKKTEWKRYRLCGILLLFTSIALSGEVILMICRGNGFQYVGLLIYAAAAYTFYNIVFAIVNVIKYKKYESPVMWAAKAINLAVALVSILSLETAMLSQFNDKSNTAFRNMMTGCTASCVCMIVLIMAIYMIAGSTKRIKKTEGKK